MAGPRRMKAIRHDRPGTQLSIVNLRLDLERHGIMAFNRFDYVFGRRLKWYLEPDRRPPDRLQLQVIPEISYRGADLAENVIYLHITITQIRDAYASWCFTLL